MEKAEKIEQLKYVINRYDHYYESVNNKGNLYLTINTFILGGSLTAYYSIKNTICVTDFCYTIFCILLIITLLSIVLTLFAIKPYLTKKLDKKKYSIIYFGDVSLLEFNNYKSEIDKLNDSKLLNDYTNQAHLLAIGLRRKFKFLNYATWVISLEIICITILGILIIN